VHAFSDFFVCLVEEATYIILFDSKFIGCDLESHNRGKKDTEELQLFICLISSIMILQTFNQPAHQQFQYAKGFSILVVLSSELIS